MMTSMLVLSLLSQVQYNYVKKTGDTMTGPLVMSTPGNNMVVAIQAEDYLVWTTSLTDPSNFNNWATYMRNTTVAGSRAMQISDYILTTGIQTAGMAAASFPACAAGTRGLVLYDTTAGRVNYCGGSGYVALTAAPTVPTSVTVGTTHGAVAGGCFTCSAGTLASSVFTEATTATTGTCTLSVFTITGGTGDVDFVLRNNTAAANILTVRASNTNATNVSGNVASLTWAYNDVLLLNQTGGVPGTYNINAVCTGLKAYSF